ncbi:hypothetical protein LINPERPRIM_LOCUS20728 [Linum perenne]
MVCSRIFPYKYPHIPSVSHTPSDTKNLSPKSSILLPFFLFVGSSVVALLKRGCVRRC